MASRTGMSPPILLGPNPSNVKRNFMVSDVSCILRRENAHPNVVGNVLTNHIFCLNVRMLILIRKIPLYVI